MAQHGILVFDFVERHNKTYKASINGFFISPDVIVLKWQKYKRREIFTLAHELGHYLLNQEEIDENVNFENVNNDLSDTEKWCNEFAFSFLIGSNRKTLTDLNFANSTNDYHYGIVEEIFKKTFLSKLSIYTFLFYNNKLSHNNYTLISDEIKAFVVSQEMQKK